MTVDMTGVFEREAGENARKGLRLAEAGRLREAATAFLRAAKAMTRCAAQGATEAMKRKRRALAEEYLARARQLMEAHEAQPEGGAGRPAAARGPARGAAAREGEPGFEREEERDREAGETPWVFLESPGVHFDDIAGCEEAKEQIRLKVILPFLRPEEAQKYGKQAGNVLLYGPPGTGKTSLAKAIATDVEAPFISVSCPDIVSKWVGESERAIRSLFQFSRAQPRCVVCMDEISGIVSRRTDDTPEHAKRLVNAFLAEVDGLGARRGRMVLLGTTNEPWRLDPAARRPGRFDRIVYVGLPEKAARAEILRRSFEGIPLDEQVDLDGLAESLEGFSGADIKGFCDRVTDRPFLREVEGKGDPRVTPQDVEEVLAVCRPTVDGEFLKRYEAFAGS